MQAELRAGRIVMTTEYRDRELVKMVPGARYDKNTKDWSVPVSYAACLALRNIFGLERLELGPELRSWVSQELDSRIRPALAARALDNTSGRVDLFGFQRVGVKFMSAAGSAILGDEPGTGKTVQTIQTIDETDAYPALIVCPKGLIGNWVTEYGKWAPHKKVVAVTGTAPKRRKILESDADVFIMNYDAVRMHSRLQAYGSTRLSDKEKTPGELNRPWGAVVLDEAHKIKDPAAKTTRAVKAVGASAARRYALTGTPVANHPGDFWSLLNFVSPEEWPSRTRFVDRFCATTWNGFGGLDIIGIRPEMRDEFFAAVDPRFIRRVKSQVLIQLPPKVYVTRTVELAGKQKKAYDDMAANMATALADGGEVVAFNPLTQLTRLSQFAAAYAEIDENGSVRLSAPSSKIDELLELLEELGDEQVVVFAESRQLIELAASKLESKGISAAQITGAISLDEREWAKDAFQAGKIRVLLLTLGAGAEGLTLTAARHMVFLQRSWSMVKNTQAEDRIHRPGAEQHDSVIITDIQTAGTIEEDVITSLEDKAAMLQEIARDPVALKKFIGGKK